MQLAVLDHPKVVNSAYFSPISGSKILTTCIDNRYRSGFQQTAHDIQALDSVMHEQVSESSPGIAIDHWSLTPPRMAAEGTRLQC